MSMGVIFATTMGERVGIGFVDLAIIGEVVRASYGGTVGSWIGPRNIPTD